MSEFLTVIQDVGFPIAVCVICFYYIYNLSKENREDAKNREDILYTKIGEISNTLIEVSKTLASINQRIEDLEEKLKEDK